MNPSHSIPAFLAIMAQLLFCPVPAADSSLRWGTGLLKQKPEWFGSSEARAVADSVLQYQSPQGGWPKNTDLAKTPRSAADIPPSDDGVSNSFDNEATTLPLHFLAFMITATGDEKYRSAFERGFDYTLAAQHPNGGWPQFFPLRKGYYSHITYNDDAMVRVLNLLKAAAAGKPPFAFISDERRAKAASAVAKGIDCILKTQIKQDGKLTAWCAQHDEKTLEPAWARSYEPPSFSGGETVGIVRFLMEIEKPTPEIIAAIEGAVAWLKSATLQGMRLEEFKNADGKKDIRIVQDDQAPPLWARFYELGTNRALYLDRDSVFRYDFNEIGHERRNGYAYHGTWPARLLDRDYPKWREQHGR